MELKNYDDLIEQFSRRFIRLIEEEGTSIESVVGINNYYMIEHASTEDPDDVLMTIAYIERDTPKIYQSVLSQMSGNKATLLDNKIIIIQLLNLEKFPHRFKRISNGDLDTIRILKYLQQKENPRTFIDVIERYKQLGYPIKILKNIKVSPYVYVEPRKKIPTKASTRKPKKVVKLCKCKK